MAGRVFLPPPVVNPSAIPSEIRGPLVSAEGKLIVAEQGASLPPRCVLCNSADRVHARSQTFVSSAVGTPFGRSTATRVIPLTALVTSVIHFSTRKKAKVHFSLCHKHFWQRRLAILGSLGMLAATLALLSWKPTDQLLQAGVFLFLVVPQVLPLWLATRGLKPARIEGRRVWLAGADQRFVDSLPH